ncbi:MAG: IS1595 family transposase [Planctomycetes bacterium]|nr:IS1595 family transposase [Planctomycetota bacterium]
MNEKELPQTLLEAVRYFSDLERCHEYMIQIKWPDGKPTCPKCGGDRVGRIKTRPGMLKCNKKACQKQFSTKVGTIFEDSPLGLDRWFVAVWCIANDKNGISSYELGRALGVSQPSAWHMLHRIRLAMRTQSFRKIRGEIESDETFIGGKAKNMHRERRERIIQGRGTVGKAIVHGLLERGGEVRVDVVPNQKKGTLQDRVRANVAHGQSVYTDTLRSYEGLAAEYVHKMIDHMRAYVECRVHTNGLENFWSLLKRALGGTYVAVAPKHLTRYCDEEAFRFNQRNGTDASRFARIMRGVVGRRLTYKELAV